MIGSIAEGQVSRFQFSWRRQSSLRLSAQLKKDLRQATLGSYTSGILYDYLNIHIFNLNIHQCSVENIIDRACLLFTAS